MKRPIATPFVLAAATVLLSATAYADGPQPNAKKVCADAYAQAQPLRDAHKLIEARAQLRVCAQSTCPGFIVADCAAWLNDAESRIPSVVLVANDASGHPVTDVSVSLDGAPWPAKLDGQSVEVNPGTHTFTFAAGDGTKVDSTVVVREAQKAQDVAVTLRIHGPSEGGSPANATGPAAGEGEPAASSSSTFWTKRHIAGAAVGGAGVVGLIVGGVFGGLTLSEVSAQKTACGAGPVCENHSQGLSDHSSAVTDAAVSTVGLIAGAALAAGGAYLLFFPRAKTESSPPPQPALTVAPSVGRNRGGVALRMEF